MEGADLDDMLSWENLIYVADLLETSGQTNISLLGGEPTLHPNFVDFVLYLINRNFHVNVFTSGIMSQNKLKDLEKAVQDIKPAGLSFVCNVNDPLKSPSDEVEKVKIFLESFPDYTSLGFNIYELNFDMKFLINYINQYGLRKTIRLGLAHPIPGVQNQCIEKNKFPEVVTRLFEFIPLFEKFNLQIGFDCGFHLCKFTNEQLGVLFKMYPEGMKFGCGPAIDIGPDMTVWSCFPLSSFQKKSIYDFDSFDEMVKFYEEFHSKVRVEVAGVYNECDGCRYRENHLCDGGCLAHSLNEFKNESAIRIKDVY
jgi:radical SAM protein with 4Fe4S-binding SPASM domain